MLSHLHPAQLSACEDWRTTSGGIREKPSKETEIRIQVLEWGQGPFCSISLWRTPSIMQNQTLIGVWALGHQAANRNPSPSPPTPAALGYELMAPPSPTLRLPGNWCCAGSAKPQTSPGPADDAEVLVPNKRQRTGTDIPGGLGTEGGATPSSFTEAERGTPSPAPTCQTAPTSSSPGARLCG